MSSRYRTKQVVCTSNPRNDTSSIEATTSTWKYLPRCNGEIATCFGCPRLPIAQWSLKAALTVLAFGIPILYLRTGGSIVSHFATMMTLFHSRAREADDRYAKGHRLRHGLVWMEKHAICATTKVPGINVCRGERRSVHSCCTGYPCHFILIQTSDAE